eukprot:TRINITY_DN14487_c0_g1_i1.p2 TRINITY_DN14487_c0_g1~~TRINITY_DN14487_c0_g1_i1.p2  ORF type:complete len:237 (-),score=80.84 TRINITY_DN14487_c0_g1_i1:148-858(-)
MLGIPARRHQQGGKRQSGELEGQKAVKFVKQQQREEGDVDMAEVAPGAGSTASLTKLLGKLTLANSQQLRELAAATVETYVVQAEIETLKRTKQATADFAKHVQGQQPSERAKHGHPHSHAFIAAAQQLAEVAKEKGMEAEHVQISKYITDVQAVQQVADRLRAIENGCTLFKIKNAYKKETKKLVVAFRYGTPEEAVWEHMRKVFVQVYKAEQKLGEAPRSNLERQVQQLVGGAS